MVVYAYWWYMLPTYALLDTLLVVYAANTILGTLLVIYAANTLLDTLLVIYAAC